MLWHSPIGFAVRLNLDEGPFVKDAAGYAAFAEQKATLDSRAEYTHKLSAIGPVVRSVV